MLHKLKIQTLKEGGPFIGLRSHHFDEWWSEIAAKAGLTFKVTKGEGEDAEEVEYPVVTLHDLRRTYITRLILAGVPLPTIQKLAGHTAIATTMRYYTKIARDDLRVGVEMLRKATAG